MQHSRLPTATLSRVRAEALSGAIELRCIQQPGYSDVASREAPARGSVDTHAADPYAEGVLVAVDRNVEREKLLYRLSRGQSPEYAGIRTVGNRPGSEVQRFEWTAAESRRATPLASRSSGSRRAVSIIDVLGREVALMAHAHRPVEQGGMDRPDDTRPAPRLVLVAIIPGKCGGVWCWRGSERSRSRHEHTSATSRVAKVGVTQAISPAG